MSLDLVNDATETEPAPKTFIRGQTLEFVMELPKKVPLNFFSDTDLHARAGIVFRRTNDGTTPKFYVVVKLPGLTGGVPFEPVEMGSNWDTDEETTVENVRVIVQAYFDNGIDFPFKCTAVRVGNKLYLVADDAGSDRNGLEFHPAPVGMHYDDDVSVNANCLTGGGPSTRARGSFVLAIDEDDTATLKVGFHQVEFKRETDMTLAEAAAGLAGAAMDDEDIPKVVTVTSDGERVILTAADEGTAGNDIEFVPGSDSGAYDYNATLFGGIDGAVNTDPVRTSLFSELRLLSQAGENGFVADLNPEWEVGSSATKIRFLVENTDEFPLGPAEFDVLLLRAIIKESTTTVSSWGGADSDTLGILTNVTPVVGEYMQDTHGYWHKISSVVPALGSGDLLGFTILFVDEIDNDAFVVEESSEIGTTIKKYRTLPVKITITDGVTQ